jgi:8-oxo-dGTP pyrophosphatase MutT (NUDIX family)
MVIKIACGAFLFDDDCVLLIKQRGKEHWVPPGGHIEENETLAEALDREVFEETGLRAHWVYGSVKEHIAPWRQSPLPFGVWTHPSKHGGEGSVLHFAGVVIDASALKIQEKEIAAVQWFPLASLKDSDVHPVIQLRAIEARAFIEQYGVR